MTIESSLERIATSLEALANHVTGTPGLVPEPAKSSKPAKPAAAAAPATSAAAPAVPAAPTGAAKPGAPSAAKPGAAKPGAAKPGAAKPGKVTTIKANGAEVYTFETVKKAVLTLAASLGEQGPAIARDMMSSFGAEKVTAIKEADYPAVMARVAELTPAA